ncbi:MAG TPA: hypothetical protein VGL93_15235 [Streptosporangiaceae bacterium]|jgi:hypothetical protein
MTAVLLLGEVPSTGYVGGVAAERVILGPNPPAVPASRFIALAADRLANQRAIIALYPSWHQGAANRFIRLARGVLNTDRIAGLPLSLPPLALSLVADQLTYLAPYVPAGLLASLATRLPDEIIAGAWVRSVAGLEHIETKMADHIRSYLPGSFMVSVAPRHGVHRISGGHPVGAIDHRPQNPIQVLATQVEGDTGWFQQKLMGEVRPSVVKFVNAQPLSASYWGVKKYVEYVAFSGHPDALSRLVNSTRTRSCAWCGEPISVRTCPFCSATRELLVSQPETETAYGTLITHPVEPEHAPPAPPDQFLTPQPPPSAPLQQHPQQPQQPPPRPGARPAEGPRPGQGPRSGPQRPSAQTGDRRVATSADQAGIYRANPNPGTAMPPRNESARRPPASTPPANPRPAAPSPAPPDVSDPRNGVL